MTRDTVWRGIRSDDLDSMVRLYGEAEQEAARRLSVRGRGRRQEAVDEIVNARPSLRAALEDELRGLGCPAEEINSSASAIVLLALRLRRSSGGYEVRQTRLFAAE
jgi:hypothetical protein